MTITWRHSLIDLVANPIASLYDGGKEEVDAGSQFYSIAAHSKRKTNKPLEAIVEIRKQLAKFPNDYEGVALLAGIQAEDLKDLASAENTFNQFCNWPDAPPKQAAAALTQLADWHLEDRGGRGFRAGRAGEDHRPVSGNPVGGAGGATHRAPGRHPANPAVGA